MNGAEVFSYTFDLRLVDANTSSYIFAIAQAQQNLKQVKLSIASLDMSLQSGSNWSGKTPKSYGTQISSICSNNTGEIEGALNKITGLIEKVNKYKNLARKFKPLKNQFYDCERQKKILYSQIKEVRIVPTKKIVDGKETIVNVQTTITHADKEIAYNNMVKKIDGLIIEGSAIIKEAQAIEKELL